MTVTRLGPDLPQITSSLGNSASYVPPGGTAGRVLTANASNSSYWGENIARITANGSNANTLVGPFANIAAGANITLSTSSNTLTITGAAGGVTGITSNGSNSVTGVPNLKAGTGVALGVSGQDITIINTGIPGPPGPASGVQSGTSNPGSPTNDQLFYRTDLDLLIFYNGTRWLTVAQYQLDVAMQGAVVPMSANNSGYAALPNSTHDLWLETIDSPTLVNTTNDGTKFWTILYQRGPSNTNLGSSFSTAADTVNVGTRHTVTVNALSGTSDLWVQWSATKTSTPGTIYLVGSVLTYRKVIP